MNSGNKYLTVALTVMVMTLCSCSGLRGLKSPEVAIPETFAPGYADSLSHADQAWWKFYTDSTLCSLIDVALTKNYDLRIAMARVREARELLGVANTNLLPTLSGQAYGSRETTEPSGHNAARDDEFGIKLTAAWEINLWGKQAYEKDVARSALLVTEDDRRSVQMTIVADLATLYYTLKALWSELAIVHRTLDTRKEDVRYAKLRYEYGAVSEVVYRQALVELAMTSSLVPGIEKRTSEANNAMAILLGELPGKVYVRGGLEADGAALAPVTVTTGLPSDLLERRPDIRASQQKLQSSMASAGIAWADRFPSFRISLTGGLENDALSGFLKSPYSYSIGSLTGPIFDFGSRKRKYKAAVEKYEQARLSYERDVCNAFREVSDAVTAYRKVCETVELRTELRDAALRYSELANANYRGGMLAYIDVLDAQRKYFDARTGLVMSIRDRYLAMVNLYKVLGGGWSDDQHN